MKLAIKILINFRRLVQNTSIPSVILNKSGIFPGGLNKSFGGNSSRISDPRHLKAWQKAKYIHNLSKPRSMK